MKAGPTYRHSEVNLDDSACDPSCRSRGVRHLGGAALPCAQALWTNKVRPELKGHHKVRGWQIAISKGGKRPWRQLDKVDVSHLVEVRR